MRQISRLLSSPGAVRASDARLVSGLAAYKTRIEPERREHRRISLACKEMETEMRKTIFSAVLAALLTATFVGASFAQGGGAGGGAGGAGSAGAGAGGAGAGAGGAAGAGGTEPGAASPVGTTNSTTGGTTGAATGGVTGPSGGDPSLSDRGQGTSSAPGAKKTMTPP
jgi:hypothetical protein